MAYSPLPSPALQGSFASPITWRSTDQQVRTGLVAPSTHAPIRAAPQQFGSFRITAPPNSSSALASANLQSVVRPSPTGSFSVASGHVSPLVTSQPRPKAPLVTSQPRPALSAIPETHASSLRRPYSESSSSMGLASGLTNMRYTKPFNSPHRDHVTHVSPSASPNAPVRSMGNMLNETRPSSPPVIRNAASPSTMPLQAGALGSKVPPRIVASFQVGAETSTPQVGLRGTMPQTRAVPSRNRMDYLTGSARTPTYPSSPTVPASAYGTKFRWDGPEVKVGASRAKVISGGLAKRPCESPLRSQQGWSPSTSNARSMPTASPSPMPTEYTDMQSLVPPLSHRTTSPLPTEVLTQENLVADVRTDTTSPLLAEVLTQENLAVDVRTDMTSPLLAEVLTQEDLVVDVRTVMPVDCKDLVGSEDAFVDKTRWPAEFVGATLTQPYLVEEPSDAIFVQAVDLVQQSPSNVEIAEVEVVDANTGVRDGEFAQNVEEPVGAYVVQPESGDYMLNEGLIPAPDVGQDLAYIPDEGQDLAYNQVYDLTWAIAADKHPLVSEEEATYVLDCLQSIRESVNSTSFVGVALDNGLCSYDARDSVDPHDVVRIVLERLLQNYSRNGGSDTFVMPGTVYSTGYKKKLPLHVFPGDGILPLSESELLAKPATMTVIWPWDVKLEPDAQYS